MALSKIQIETINLLEGNQIHFKDFICMIEYPCIITEGQKRRLTHNEWEELLKGYWAYPENDGYWLLKDIKQEFGCLN